MKNNKKCKKVKKMENRRLKAKECYGIIINKYTHIVLGKPTGYHVRIKKRNIKNQEGRTRMPNVVEKINEQILTEQNDGSANTPDIEELKPINIKNAANYVIKLFYDNKRQCKSAVVQKILVMAQIKAIKDLGEPLFDNVIRVKPSCFSIEFISQVYPITIFDDEDWSAPVETDIKRDTNGRRVSAQISNADFDNMELSYFYEIFEEIPPQYSAILREAYSWFGGYSGNHIGKCMREMSLHSENIGSEIDADMLRECINNGTYIDGCCDVIVDFFNFTIAQ